MSQVSGATSGCILLTNIVIFGLHSNWYSPSVAKQDLSVLIKKSVGIGNIEVVLRKSTGNIQEIAADFKRGNHMIVVSGNEKLSPGSGRYQQIFKAGADVFALDLANQKQESIKTSGKLKSLYVVSNIESILETLRTSHVRMFD